MTTISDPKESSFITAKKEKLSKIQNLLSLEYISKTESYFNFLESLPIENEKI